MVGKETFFMVDGYANLLDDYTFCFHEHEQEVVRGTYSAFDEAYLPVLREQGVGMIYLSVGGEHTAQVMYGATDRYNFWDVHKNLDLFACEEENRMGQFILCRCAADIDRAISENKIAIIAALSGGKALEGKSNYQTLANLRTLYRAGLRAVQLTGNGRNRLGDGCGQHCTMGRLTDYGVLVVKEAERLGMILDTAQLNDAGFFDLAEITKMPLLDSHTCARELSNHPQNISLDRMRIIAGSGGVVCLSFRTALVATEKNSADASDLIRQIDYTVDAIGIDHVAFGPDYCGFKTPKDRNSLKGFANVGFVESDYQTPYQSEKYPGYLDGVWYGIRKNDFIEGPTCREKYGYVADALLKHGYTDTDCTKLLGGNLMRLYRSVLK